MTPGPSHPECYRHSGREAYIRCQRCDRTICPDCMVPASVGFQCPECVQQGAKQTRQGQAAYGGKRSANPMLTSWVLIGLNVAVWLLITATGRGSSEWVRRLALMGEGICVPDSARDSYYQQIGTSEACDLVGRTQGATTWIPGVADGAWWQLATSMFTHVDLMHIGFNMLALWFLAPQLEMALGRLRFLAVYLGSGLVGSAVVYLLSDPNGYTVGASGAVFGLMGALVVVGHKVGGDIKPLLVWIGINVVITVSSPQISWQGHLGGFLGGALLAAIIAYAPKQRRTTWQAVGFSAVMLMVALVVAARTVVLV